MAYPANSGRAVISGFSPSEIWEFGFGLTGMSITSQVDADTAASAIASTLSTTALSQLRALLTSSDQGFTGVKLYCYPTGGTKAAYIGSHGITPSAGTSSNVNPLQVAMCVTLLTGAAGRRNRGRCYLPAGGATITSGHQFDTTTTTSIATGLAAFFSALNAASNPGGKVSVISQTSSAGRQVLSVAVDQRPDVQRRRANKQPGNVVETHAVTP